MTSTPPPPFVAPAPRPNGAAVRGVLAVVLAAIVIAAASGVGTLFHRSGPQYPSRWDPRVLDIVHFVERERGHTFDHPVPVYFLSAKEYRKASQGGDDVSAPTKADRRDSSLDAAELRAVGVLQGDPDLLDAGKELADSGTLAFYDQDADVVDVRGSKMTVGLRVTLAHELTHALQDQQFDVVSMLDTSDSEAATAARSVIEGDATAVENAYVAQLSTKDQQAYDDESSGESDDAESSLGDVPDVLTTLFGLPYALGSSFVDLVDADGAHPRLDRIDEVFRRMPANTSQLFTPADYFADVRPTKVTAPKVGAGKEHNNDVLGAGFLFVMLSERVEPAKAMKAVDGWRGDAYRSVVVKDGSSSRLCLAAEIRADSNDDGANLRDALTTWADAMPSKADATIGGSGPTATLRSCDPGKDADMALTGKSSDALAYPVVRSQLAAGQIAGGMSRTKALCVSGKVVPELTLDELSASELTDELRTKLQGLVVSAIKTC